MTDLPDTIAATVGALSEAHVKALSAAYRRAAGHTPGSAALARQAVPAPHRDVVDRMNTAWSVVPELPGSAIAVALESVACARLSAGGPKVEVVVTGPDSPAVAVRLTSEVVRQLIAGAASRVTLVSFAAYQVASIVEALDAAATRGVQVSLIFESPEYLEGGGGAHAYARYLTYHWPPDRREPPDAKLHAKAVIVDGRDVLLTSANMTNAAYDRNIELGVLCRGGGVAAQVQRHFDALIARGVLTPVS